MQTADCLTTVSYTHLHFPFFHMEIYIPGNMCVAGQILILDPGEIFKPQGLFAEISSLPVIKIIKTAAHHLNNNLIFICFLRLQSGYQTAVLEHIDVIGYLKYLLETVRHEDEGDPLLF